MQKQRLAAQGRLSEFFGSAAIVIDEFMKYVGLQRSSEETWQAGVDPELALILQSYADGVNDYVQGVSLNPFEEKTARLLPPEFIAFGITKENFDPWTAIDCILIVRLMSFHLTWNWAADL